MELTVYLSGEIHTKWRDEIISKCEILKLPIDFLSPVTNHELSDDVGIEILGKELPVISSSKDFLRSFEIVGFDIKSLNSSDSSKIFDKDNISSNNVSSLP